MTKDDDHLAEGSVPLRPSRRLVAGLVVAVLAVAAIGYWKTGAPLLARGGAAAPGDATIAAEGPASAASGANPTQQIAAMVDRLAERMKETPDDAQGWTMLARSYTVLGRFADALPAYRRALELRPKSADLLADYADAVAATKSTANNPESIALIERALAVDAEHMKALALAGTVAYERGDYRTAIADWQKIVDRLPADNQLMPQVRASIDEARAHLVGAPAAPPTVAIAAPASSATPKATTGQSVSGTVTLDPAFSVQAAPGDAVFVFARAASGGRMPLAVRRVTVADLPLTFTLDDSMAMAPGMTISSAKELVVGARISKSGNALPQPGDLAGEVGGVVPGTKNVAVRIGAVVGRL